MSKTFYIYTHRKADTGEIFYIGKGTGKRDRRKDGRSLLWKRIVSKHGYTIIKTECNTEKTALAIEHLLILANGRIDLGTGSLCNLTDGGESASAISPITKKLKSDKAIKMWQDESIKKKIMDSRTAAYQSKDYKKERSQIATRLNSDPDHKEKKSQTMKVKYLDPLFAESQRQKSIESNNRPGMKERKSATMKKLLANNPELVLSRKTKLKETLKSPEQRIKKSESARFGNMLRKETATYFEIKVSDVTKDLIKQYRLKFGK